jgi:hypothetical protein
LVAFVGCDLKIDNLCFKSQKSNTGFANVEKDSQFSIYPNPSNDKMFIRGIKNEPTKLEIYNLEGLTVYVATKFDSNTNQIDICNVPAGLYFLKVSDKEKIYIKKILIKSN